MSAAPRPVLRTIGVGVALLATIALGAWLRLLPCLADPGSVLYGDAAFHFRMVQETVARGSVPAVDSLANAPAGRELARLLPVGFYVVAAGVDPILGAIGAEDPGSRARLFIAICGALIAGPVFLAARTLFRHRGAALAAAAAAVIVPAHLHRSFCYWYRYEPLGALLISSHIALALTALSSRGRAVWPPAVLSALALIASLWVWRVAFMIPLLETMFVAGWVVVAPPSVRVRSWFTAMAAATALSCLVLGYLREQSFLASSGTVAVLGIAAALWLPPLREARSRRPARALAVAAVAAVAVLVGALVPVERQYGHVLDAAARKLTASAGVTAESGHPMTELALGIEELQGTSIASLVGPAQLSSLGWVLLVVAFLAWRRRRSMSLDAESGAAWALAAFLCLALLAITVLFERNKILLGPLVALWVGGVVAWALEPDRPAPERRDRSRGHKAGAARAGRATSPAAATRAPRASAFAIPALAVLFAGLGHTAWTAYELARSRQSRLDVGLVGALEHLHQTTPPGAIVLGPWERGYEIQTYAQRRTLVDGLLEDPLTQRRVVEIAAALLQPRPDSLASLSRRLGAQTILLPPSNFLGGLLSELPPELRAELGEVRRKVREGIALTPEEAERVVIRMMVLGQSPAPFIKTFEQNDWRVYRRVD
jgi:hypothetical protein